MNRNIIENDFNDEEIINGLALKFPQELLKNYTIARLKAKRDAYDDDSIIK
jgi:hypothetical protein